MGLSCSSSRNFRCRTVEPERAMRTIMVAYVPKRMRDSEFPPQQFRTRQVVRPVGYDLVFGMPSILSQEDDKMIGSRALQPCCLLCARTISAASATSAYVAWAVGF